MELQNFLEATAKPPIFNMLKWGDFYIGECSLDSIDTKNWMKCAPIETHGPGITIIRPKIADWSRERQCICSLQLVRLLL